MYHWLIITVVGAVAWLLLIVVSAAAFRRSRALAGSMLSEVTLEPETENRSSSAPDIHLPRNSKLRRILIVGAGKVGRTLARGLEAKGDCKVIGFVDEEMHSTPTNDYPVLGGHEDTFQLIQKYQIDDVVVAFTPSPQQDLVVKLAIKHPDVRVQIVPTSYEALLHVARIESHEDIALVRLVTQSEGMKDHIKRASDLVWSIAGLLFLSPLLVASALLIRFTSRGPIIFEQERTGRYGKPFTMYKFRTMVTDAEQLSGPILANGQRDERLTRVGKFLRLCRIDEIPQLWNILRGEMSLVGPRPERPVFVEKFEMQRPAYALRHRVRPGITGLAQVCGGYHTDARDKLRFDLVYVSHHSLWLDFTIIMRTLLVVIYPRRASKEYR